MTEFRKLRDLSRNFEAELQQVSADLFSARVGVSFEDLLSKKLSNLNFLKSKLKLLEGKALAVTPQISGVEKDPDAINNDYGYTVTWKIIEQQTVKSLTRAHAVKTLLLAPNQSLEPDLVERKEKIIESLLEYRQQEAQWGHLDNLVKEREETLANVRNEWDSEIGSLRDRKNIEMDESEDMQTSGPVYQKLSSLVVKLELMRWLISKLVTARTSNYDWLSDPHKRIGVLKLTRQPNTIESFLQS